MSEHGTPPDLASTHVRVTEFDPDRAGDAELDDWHGLIEGGRRVDRPEYPPLSRRAALGRLRPPSGDAEVRLWSAHEGPALVGGAILVLHGGANPHLAQPLVLVHPEQRGRGIGRLLGDRMLAGAREAGRTTVVTDIRVGGAGERLAAAMGFTPALTEVSNLLRLSDVDTAAVREWAAGAGSKTGDLTLIRWVDRVPDEHMDAFLEARAALDDMPMEDLEIRPDRPTAQSLREHEKSARRRGLRLYALAAHEPATGRIAGYTTVHVEPDMPWSAVGTTAVQPAYRGRGISLRVKAAMIEWLRVEEPQLTGYLTGNAAGNEPMRRVNERLGYRVLEEVRAWQRTL